jgi:hypothetical protein
LRGFGGVGAGGVDEVPEEPVEPPVSAGPDSDGPVEEEPFWLDGAASPFDADELLLDGLAMLPMS